MMHALAMMNGRRPWYREPWPWLLMLGPATVVAAGFFTLWLAVTSNDGLVADDYYKQGLAINQTLARSDRAKAMGLSARVRVDAEQVTVVLATRNASALPERIRVSFSHPTRSGLDQAVDLLRLSGGAFRGAAPVLAGGRWQVVLEDAERTWRLAGSLHIPDEPEAELGVAPG